MNALLGFGFLSALYAEVAVAILLKMIFRVFSFSSIFSVETETGNCSPPFFKFLGTVDATGDASGRR